MKKLMTLITGLVLINLGYPYAQGVAVTASQHVGMEHNKVPSLHEALSVNAALGNLDEVKRHVQQGAAINYRDEQGRTALWMAIYHKRHPVVEYLLTVPHVDRKFIGLDESLQKNMTALELARAVGNSSVIALVGR